MRRVRAITRTLRSPRALATTAALGLALGALGSFGILKEAYGQSGAGRFCVTCPAVACGMGQGECQPVGPECGALGGNCTPQPRECGDYFDFDPMTGTCPNLTRQCGASLCL